MRLDVWHDYGLPEGDAQIQGIVDELPECIRNWAVAATLQATHYIPKYWINHVAS